VLDEGSAKLLRIIRDADAARKGSTAGSGVDRFGFLCLDYPQQDFTSLLKNEDPLDGQPVQFGRNRKRLSSKSSAGRLALAAASTLSSAELVAGCSRSTACSATTKLAAAASALLEDRR
jgi:hypothetical protein